MYVCEQETYKYIDFDSVATVDACSLFFSLFSIYYYIMLAQFCLL